MRPAILTLFIMLCSQLRRAFTATLSQLLCLQRLLLPLPHSECCQQSVMKGMSMGKLTLPATAPGQKTEACLTLVSSSSSNSRPIFKNLADIQIIRHLPGSSSAAASIASLTAIAAGTATDGVDSGAGGVRDAVPAKSVNVSEQLRLQHGWVQGQGSMESLFSPYDAEDIGECAECLVAI
jgi:hypothetical protein